MGEDSFGLRGGQVWLCRARSSRNRDTTRSGRRCVQPAGAEQPSFATLSRTDSMGSENTQTSQSLVEQPLNAGPLVETQSPGRSTACRSSWLIRPVPLATTATWKYALSASLIRRGVRRMSCPVDCTSVTRRPAE